MEGTLPVKLNYLLFPNLFDALRTEHDSLKTRASDERDLQHEIEICHYSLLVCFVV
jgi:hypothetical protein